jgi:hypothetical protein
VDGQHAAHDADAPPDLPAYHLQEGRPERVDGAVTSSIPRKFRSQELQPSTFRPRRGDAALVDAEPFDPEGKSESVRNIARDYAESR